MLTCYRHDSVINEEVNYDLLHTIHGIESGEISCPELLGHSTVSKTQESIPSVYQKIYATNKD